jgi:hypothetical protein
VGGGYELEAAASGNEPEGVLVTEAGPHISGVGPTGFLVADGWTARMVNGIYHVSISVYAICVFA